MVVYSRSNGKTSPTGSGRVYYTDDETDAKYREKAAELKLDEWGKDLYEEEKQTVAPPEQPLSSKLAVAAIGVPILGTTVVSQLTGGLTSFVGDKAKEYQDNNYDASYTTSRGTFSDDERSKILSGKYSTKYYKYGDGQYMRASDIEDKSGEHISATLKGENSPKALAYKGEVILDSDNRIINEDALLDRVEIDQDDLQYALDNGYAWGENLYTEIDDDGLEHIYGLFDRVLTSSGKTIDNLTYYNGRNDDDAGKYREAYWIVDLPQGRTLLLSYQEMVDLGNSVADVVRKTDGLLKKAGEAPGWWDITQPVMVSDPFDSLFHGDIAGFGEDLQYLAPWVAQMLFQSIPYMIPYYNVAYVANREMATLAGYDPDSFDYETGRYKTKTNYTTGQTVQALTSEVLELLSERMPLKIGNFWKNIANEGVEEFATEAANVFMTALNSGSVGSTVYYDTDENGDQVITYEAPESAGEAARSIVQSLGTAFLGGALAASPIAGVQSTILSGRTRALQADLNEAIERGDENALFITLEKSLDDNYNYIIKLPEDNEWVMTAAEAVRYEVMRENGIDPQTYGKKTTKSKSDAGRDNIKMYDELSPYFEKDTK